jgi:hypothetical protein
VLAEPLTHFDQVVAHRRVRTRAFSRCFALALMLGGCTADVARSDTAPVAGGPAAAGQPSTAGTTSTGGSGGAAGTPGAGGTAPGSGAGGTVTAGGSGTTTCASTASSGAPVPMRRLTASQVERTVADVLGVDVTLRVEDERLLAYRSNISTSVDTASARGYFDFAGAVVAAADLSRCETDCRAWLLDDVGRRLFRRALTADERTRYDALFTLSRQNVTPQDAAGWVLEALLQSPTFLYLDEAVRADGTLDDLSVASRLALLLWGKNPDDALLSRAERGELATATAVQQEVTRLLADARSVEGIREFVDQWLDLGRLDDPDVRPDLTDLGQATVSALREEPVTFFHGLLRSGAGLSDLLTSSRTVASAELEPLYGADILSQSGDGVELDPTRRRGILALPGVVAAASHARRTSPTLRGKAILTGFLCTPPEPPPADVDTTLPEIDENAGTRERLEVHMSAPACKGCHAAMDGIGFTLEKLDWLGRYRAEENGVAIDDSATFPLGPADVTVNGTAELATTLSTSPGVAVCVARQWLRYSLGVTESGAADCLVEKLAQDLSGSAGLERMIVTALTSDWFRRGPGVTP